VFPLLSIAKQQPRVRDNTTYDSYLALGLANCLHSNMDLRDQMRGHVGVCLLRKLRYFDVGKSFVSDSLHNVYHGVMVS
jgi:hypothetical protein